MNATAAPVIDHEQLLSSAEALGGLPATVTRLAAVVCSPHQELREIVEVVSFDQELTAALLRRANSAALGARAEIRTLRDAVMWLGSGALLSMALAASLSRRVNEPIPAYGLAEGQLWRQSVAASLAGEVITARARVEVPAEVPTAALLHDFGKVVLAQHFGPRVLNLLGEAAAAEGLGLLEAERTVLGTDHADVGGLVAQHWKLPQTIVEAITHHHHAGPHPTTVSAAVSLAHAMVPEVLATVTEGTGDGAVPCTPPADPVQTHAAVLATLRIEVAEYGALLAAARDHYAELATRYGVD